MSSNLESIYREIVLDHHRHPRGRRRVQRVDGEAKGSNPNCGDEVTIRLTVESERVQDIQVDGHGCAISVASGSMLYDMVKNMPLDEVEALSEAFRQMMRDQEISGDVQLGDLEALEGVKKYPMRVKCALLPWTTLAEILKSQQEQRTSIEVTTESGDQGRESKI